MAYKRSVAGMLFLLFSFAANSAILPPLIPENFLTPADDDTVQIQEQSPVFHHNSIHPIDLRYADKARGIKPIIAPALLIGSGTALHIFPRSNTVVRDFVRKNMALDTNIEDYLEFTPVATVYLLNLTGIKGKNNYGNLTAIAAKSIVLSSFITWQLKHTINATRPNEDTHSFPSGHTSTAFTFAQLMHREFGERSVWYSIGAYTAAGAVGAFRMANDYHWLSDVLAGAGIGILSTELIYLTHQYKWNKDNIKQLTIFPFRTGKQNGLTVVYNF